MTNAIVLWTVACRGGGGRGGHGPRAQALEGAPAQLVGANVKTRGEFQPSKSICYGPRAPYALGGLSFPFLAEDLFFFFFFFFFCLSIFPSGGNANSGGGAPMQALAPGRWRPSVRH